MKDHEHNPPGHHKKWHFKYPSFELLCTGVPWVVKALFTLVYFMEKQKYLRFCRSFSRSPQPKGGWRAAVGEAPCLCEEQS